MIDFRFRFCDELAGGLVMQLVGKTVNVQAASIQELEQLQSFQGSMVIPEAAFFLIEPEFAHGLPESLPEHYRAYYHYGFHAYDNGGVARILTGLTAKKREMEQQILSNQHLDIIQQVYEFLGETLPNDDITQTMWWQEYHRFLNQIIDFLHQIRENHHGLYVIGI